ncbi:MAG: hypothetical protein Q9228_006056 [Teloschistes exilis]
MRLFRAFIFKFYQRSSTYPRRPLSTSPIMSSSGTAAALYAATIAPASVAAMIPEEAMDKPHHLQNGKGFHNPWDSWKEMSGPQIGWAMAKRKITGTGNSPDTTPPTVPVRKPQFLTSRETPTLRATWLGHACYFIEFPGGLRVLFDPVFEARCSPFTWLGPKRYTEVPCEIEDIPIVDAVVISHSHYDHLSHPSIKRIQARHPNAHFFVPLRLKHFFTSSGINNVTELDWWDERDLQLTESNRDSKPRVSVETDSSIKASEGSITARISCLPCQHTSARTAFDKGQTLWASWSVSSGGRKVWFGGDTGYRAVPQLPTGVDDYGPDQDHPHCPAFAQIGRTRGPFDLGLIPIGAYDPRWIMSSMHANPFDSVNIFKDTRCKRAMGIHWGTWVLTEEDVLEPPLLLKKALSKSGFAEEGVFDVCDIGESREFA